MTRALPAVVAVAVIALATATQPAAATPPITPSPVPPPTPSVATARLQGSFLLAGRVTGAENVRGERRGETALRTWTFSSGCAAGPCATVALARRRAHGTDKVTLRRVSAGHYRGTGHFDAPLRCAKRVYHRGQAIPFTITVQITAAGVVNGVVLATRLQSSYANRTRSNSTPCFAVLGHDAATYHGHLVTKPTPPTGGGTPPRP